MAIRTRFLAELGFEPDVFQLRAIDALDAGLQVIHYPSAVEKIDQAIDQAINQEETFDTSPYVAEPASIETEAVTAGEVPPEAIEPAVPNGVTSEDINDE